MSKDLDKKAYWDWLRREMQEVEELYYSGMPPQTAKEMATSPNMATRRLIQNAFKRELVELYRLSRCESIPAVELQQKALAFARSFGLSCNTMRFYFEKMLKRQS